MTLINPRRRGNHTDVVAEGPLATEVDVIGGRRGGVTRKAVAVLRIAYGLTFLWAFLDKLLALGYHTGYDQAGHLDRFGDAAWIHGGSPTFGFLSSAEGPLSGLWHSVAGDGWIDWLFMLGLLGVGVCLTFGVAMWPGAVVGALMYVGMWSVVLPPENNPVLDDHLLGGLTLVVLALLAAGRTWGAGRWWAGTGLVRRWPALS